MLLYYNQSVAAPLSLTPTSLTYSVYYNNFSIGNFQLELKKEKNTWVRTSTLVVSGLARSLLKYNLREIVQFKLNEKNQILINTYTLETLLDKTPTGVNYELIFNPNSTVTITTTNPQDANTPQQTEIIKEISNIGALDENTWLLQVGLDFATNNFIDQKSYTLIDSKGEVIETIATNSTTTSVATPNPVIQMQKGNQIVVVTLNAEQNYLPMRIERWKKGKLELVFIAK